MRPAALVLLVLALATPAVLASGEYPGPIPESYEVVVAHPVFGAGIGRMWGSPQMGVTLVLDLTFGDAWFTFSSGGRHDERSVPGVGTVAVDDWTRPFYERFVGGYLLDATGAPTGVGWGEGRMFGFVIQVTGYS